MSIQQHQHTVTTTELQWTLWQHLQTSEPLPSTPSKSADLTSNVSQRSHDRVPWSCPPSLLSPLPSPLLLSHGRQHYPCHCHHQCCNCWADCHGGSKGTGRRIHQVQNGEHSSQLVQAARRLLSSSFTRPTCLSIPIHENVCLSHALWSHPIQSAMSASILHISLACVVSPNLRM